MKTIANLTYTCIYLLQDLSLRNDTHMYNHTTVPLSLVGFWLNEPESGDARSEFV